MIVKIVKGRSARGLLSYLARSSKDRVGIPPFATNLAGQTVREWSAQVSAIRSLKPCRRTSVVRHLVMSLPSGQKLDIEGWSRAVEIARTHHGFSGAPWAAFRHEDTCHDHVHVFFWDSTPRETGLMMATTTEETSRPLARLSWSSTFRQSVPNHDSGTGAAKSWRRRSVWPPEPKSSLRRCHERRSLKGSKRCFQRFHTLPWSFLTDSKQLVLRPSFANERTGLLMGGG